MLTKTLYGISSKSHKISNYYLCDCPNPKLFSHIPICQNHIMLHISSLVAFTIFSSFIVLNNNVRGVGSFQLAPTRTIATRGTITHHNNCHRLIKQQASCLSSYNNDNNDQQIDSLIYSTSKVLRSTSWFSWWSQVILTVISSITFFFARNVMDAQQSVNPMQFKVASKFFLPGLGIITSSISIVWTWGQRRLSRRFLRRSNTSRVEAANLLRRVIKVGVSLNLVGLLTSILGSQYIVGTLVAKSMTSFSVGGVSAAAGGVVAQTLQPLDVLVVQASTNILSSHFVSLACLLWLSRMVDQLDPPSLEDDLGV